MKKSFEDINILFENWMPNVDELKDALIKYKQRISSSILLFTLNNYIVSPAMQKNIFPR